MKTTKLLLMLMMFIASLPGFSQSQCECTSGNIGTNLVSNASFNSITQPTWTVTTPTAPVWLTVPPLVPNRFTIASNPVTWNGNWCGVDHTTGTGNMLLVDPKQNSSTAGWGQNIGTVSPNTTYIFSVWINNLVCTINFQDPVIQLRVNGTNVGTSLSLIEGDWVQLCGTWISPAVPPATTTIEIVQTMSTSATGKDFAVDDVSFAACLAPPITPNAGIDDTICAGYATQLNGSATGTGPFTYSWAPATGLSCTNCQNPIAAPLTTTTYTLTVTSGSSTATDAVNVVVNQNCCSASTNDVFQMINSSFTLTMDAYYNGKYLLGPGVIITVDGVNLDLTNVDMVFSPCSGIEFRNGASLVANNSVFRPCDMNLWWLGFSFFDGSTGTVNSCTFENAGKALEFDGSTGVDAYSNITNNLFLNCRKGVNIVGGNNFLESITNNVFTVDFNNIDYSIPTCGGVITTPLEYHAIEVNSSDLSSAYISQNQFINNQVGTAAKAMVWGIYYLSVTGGAISQNTFTNLYRDIDASESANLSIENNEMELLQLVSSTPDYYQYQIRLTGCSYIWVTGNHLVNSVEVTDFNNVKGGSIYTEHCFAVNVKDNTIDGSRGYGITCVNNYGSSYTGNILNGINQIGILMSDLQQCEVNCNEIHIQRNANFTFDGTGIYYVGSLLQSMNNSILSNCIFDAVYPIALSPYVPNLPGPVISNNYLYNYTGAGILNYGCILNLGSGVSSYAVSGHNTFHSNTAIAGVTDIYSATPLIAYGNYGISTISGSVTTVGNNIYSSTASCGQQIGPYANNQADENICDHFFLNLLDSLAMKSPSGEMMLAPAFEQKMNNSELKFSLSQFTSLLQLLQSSNPAEADRLFALMQENSWLSANDFGIFKFYHSFFAYDFVTASADLNALNGIADVNWFAVKNILVNHLQADGSLNQISDHEIENLKTIELSSSSFASDARELLQATVGGYDYHFKTFPALKGIEGTAGISVTQAQLQIYPNPAHTEASIEYVLPDGLSNATLVLYDLSGRQIETQNLEAANSLVTINLEKLSTGIYIVTLENAGRILLRGKLIKE